MAKGFSYLLYVIGKLIVKLYKLINNYRTDVCFQFHLINSMSNNVTQADQKNTSKGYGTLVCSCLSHYRNTKVPFLKGEVYGVKM